MKNIGKITFGFLFFLLLGAISISNQKNISLKSTSLQANVLLEDLHQYNFANGEYLIRDYFSKKEPSPEENQGKDRQILGGITSHHLPTAFPLIADFYQNLKGTNPDVVFVLGPDHFHKSSAEIATTNLPFYTPFGLLEIDDSIVSALEKKNLIKIDNQVFENEHSILSQTFFIKYLFPGAKIVPLIFQTELLMNEAKTMAQALEPYTKNALFIASVDFSHYLPLEKAEILDQATKEKMENLKFDYLAIKENDSPVSLQTLFLLAGKDGYNFKVLELKNSADFAQSKDKTTGYISAIFEK